MSDAALRFLVVVVLLGAAFAIGLAATRFARPSHPRVDVRALGLQATVVMFTAIDCTTCGEARALLRELDVTVREVTHELEPAAFESAGVAAVPMTAVIDGHGSVTAQYAGVPPRRRLKRALRDAGIVSG